MSLASPSHDKGAPYWPRVNVVVRDIHQVQTWKAWKHVGGVIQCEALGFFKQLFIDTNFECKNFRLNKLITISCKQWFDQLSSEGKLATDVVQFGELSNKKVRIMDEEFGHRRTAITTYGFLSLCTWTAAWRSKLDLRLAGKNCLLAMLQARAPLITASAIGIAGSIDEAKHHCVVGAAGNFCSHFQTLLRMWAAPPPDSSEIATIVSFIVACSEFTADCPAVCFMYPRVLERIEACIFENFNDEVSLLFSELGFLGL
jgi:hypothetical protein